MPEDEAPGIVKSAAGTENNCIDKPINDGMPAAPPTKVDDGNYQDNFPEFPHKDGTKDHGTDNYSALSSRTIHTQTEHIIEVNATAILLIIVCCYDDDLM